MLTYRKYNSSDEQELNRFVDSIFGKNYHLNKSYNENGYFTFLCESKNEIVSCVIGRVLDESKGILDLIGVHKDYRNQGVGSKLFSIRNNQFKELGIHNLELFHWVRSSNPIPKLAIHHGFQLKEEIEDYWKKVSLKYKSDCPECGGPPCVCKCLVYKKNTLNEV